MGINNQLDRPVKLRYVLLLSLLFFFFFIGFAGLVRNQYFFGHKKIKKIENIVIGISSFPKSVKDVFCDFFFPSSQCIAIKDPLKFQLNIRKTIQDQGCLLLSSYDEHYEQDIMEIIELSTNRIIHKWLIPLGLIEMKLDPKGSFYSKFFGLSKNIRFAHPILSKGGNVIFLLDNGNLYGKLVEIDVNSNIIWVINKVFSHSIEVDKDGDLWVPSILKSSDNYQNKLGQVNEDALTEISNEGKIKFQKSVPEILMNNGYGALLMGVGGFEEDPLHVNEIRPALHDGKYWQKGDLLVSLRHRSTVFLYRPSTNKILWLQTGPWLNQHCPDFVDSTRISVFGNDVVRTYQGDSLLNGYNNIYIYNFADHTITTPYTEAMKKAKVQTITEGRAKILPGGDVFVEESNYGRMLRLSKTDIIWKYVNKVDENHVSIGNWSRYLLKNGDCQFCFTEDFYNGQVH